MIRLRTLRGQRDEGKAMEREGGLKVERPPQLLGWFRGNRPHMSPIRRNPRTKRTERTFSHVRFFSGVRYY
jgi:hypothetical protein